MVAIELISRETLNILRRRTELPESLAVDAHLLLVELSGPDASAELEKVQKMLQSEGFRQLAAPAVARDADEIDRLWGVRKEILWLIRNPQPGFQALSVVNDVGVPPEQGGRMPSGWAWPITTTTPFAAPGAISSRRGQSAVTWKTSSAARDIKASTGRTSAPLSVRPIRVGNRPPARQGRLLRISVWTSPTLQVLFCLF